MKKQQAILWLVTSIFLSSCSTVKSYLLGSNSDRTAIHKPLNYNLMQPRREILSNNLAQRLSASPQNNNRFKYYSANGHKCMLLSQTHSKSACLINGIWKEAAPVLVVR